MKDFNGNYANENPKLDSDNLIYVIENRNSGDEISRNFTPSKDGIIILFLRTVKDSYMHVQTKDGVVLGSLSWPAQQTSTKDLRTIIPVSKNQEIRCWGTWCDVYFIPYL
jgi:hypothetical protein